MPKDVMSNSLYRLLLKNEKEAAQRVYLKQPKLGIWHELTWAEVMLQARKVACFLQQLGLKKGSRIAIISKNCAEWFISDFGIHLAGMVCVPLFANQHEESIHYILAHAEVSLVFVGKLDFHRQVRAYIPESYLTLRFDYHEDLQTNYSWSEVLASEPLRDLLEPEPEDLYTIIYSSGTTGTPKGAMYTNLSIAHYLTLFPEDLLRVRELPHYRLVSYLPLAHVYERSAIQLASVSINCNVSFIESLPQFVENLQHIQPNFFTAVPRIWGVFQQRIEKKIAPTTLDFLLKIPLVSHLIKNKIIKKLGLKDCVNCFSGASSLSASILDFFEKIGLHIQEGYGQTENMAYATLSLLQERREGYVGTPRLKVAIDLNEEGELLMHSPCLMSGYYKEKEVSAAAFTAEGWLRTGDLAEIDANNCVRILGRITEPFKNQTGEFVVPSPIEHQFEMNGLTEQLCLVGQGLANNILLVTLNETLRSEESKDSINQSLKQRLHQVNNGLLKHEKVHQIIIVKNEWTPGSGLLTPTLKVKRRAVEQKYKDLIPLALLQSQNIVWESELLG